ncbi:hypothetical protein [Candidatus Uabimicrobium sp. HlEnr_7]|uniref:hypothetical protein n=1 Tax=Candidatus Uabimicrobium helgolandensis TaxID=3095367 RepID=UPI003557D9F4
MRTYIRRLKNCGLQSGYIGTTAFKGVIPTKIFLCIWPTDPNIKNRAYFSIRKIAGNNIFVLQTTVEHRGHYVLKFDKTANIFDSEGFFWTAAKGHNFQIETKDIENNQVFFCCDHINKNRFFLDMLQVISAENHNEDVSLVDYLQKTFNVRDKNTYGFAIYLQVDFKRDKIQFGNSCEEVYRFVSPRFFLGDINISALLYEYNKDYQAQTNSTTVDPKVIEQTHSDVGKVDSIETRQSVRDVLKNCISSFLNEKHQQQLNDDDYTCLVEDILENLSKVYHEN